MTKRSKAPARLLAVIALIAGFVVVIVVFASALGGGSSESSVRTEARKPGARARSESKAPKVYVVKSGDTLLGIAHKTGVSIAKIERLNPKIDPQILIAGEKLKLR